MTDPAQPLRGAPPAVVTFDCYSALVDSRAGLIAAFTDLTRERRWRADPEELTIEWDTRNKALQRDTEGYVPYTGLAQQAMAATHERFALSGDPGADTEALLATIPEWQPFPDVPDGVAAVAARYPVALLTNIDDHLLARTRPGYDFPRAVTSEQARCYKPRTGLYRYAEARLGSPLLHVPASARDVRGALEAGLEVVRVVRPGHALDAAGPAPEHRVDDLRELAGLLP